MLPDLQQAADELQQLLLQDRTNRGEVKTWLINTFAQLQHISPSARWACFHPCNSDLNSSDSSSRRRPSTSRSSAAQQQRPHTSPVAVLKEAQLHVLQLLAELAPADVSTLLLRDPDWLCSFLTASRDRIKAWFGGFGPTSIQHFKYGARALANYALAERAEAWRHLVWSGKHSQSPVAVAAKPHYFGELDVVATLNNLARSCPMFWTSDELKRSCQAGDWLALDRDTVAKELLRLLHEQHSSRHQPLQQLLSDVLASADWVTLCHRLLPLLPDKGLRQVAHTLADDLHSPQQAQQQQQQGRQGGNSNIISLLACWCREQTTHSAQLAAAAAAAADGPAGDHQQQVLAALQAAATPAAQLACVTQPHMLLLGCLQSAQQGKDSWRLDQLLLANALTCYRSQLLVLLRQEDDSSNHLGRLAAAAAAICPSQHHASIPAQAAAAQAAGGAVAGGAAAEAVGATAAAGQEHGQVRTLQLTSAVQGLPRSERLLLVLVAGWLLRLQVMLQLSGAAATSAQQQQQQAPAMFVPQCLPTGDMCHLLMTSSAPAPPAAGDAEPLQEARAGPGEAEFTTPAAAPKQHQQQEVQQQQQQQQQPVKTPLRRGLPSAGNARAVSDKDSHGSKGEQGSRKRRRHHSKRCHNNSSRVTASLGKKHGEKRRRSSSESSASGSDSSSNSSSGRRRRKRRRRCSRNSSSSDDATAGSDADWAGLDLDADGELLDPAAFQMQLQGAAQQGAHKQQQQTGNGAAQQQGCVTGPESSAVQGCLSDLAVGGRLWQRPRCVVQVSRVPEGALGSTASSVGAGQSADAAQGQPGSPVVVCGSIAEVSDAVAQMWVCCAVASVCRNG